MPEGISLNPVSYVVLGLVRSMGSATPYELKQRVAISIGYFWPFPHSQLYAEPARLAAAGLLTEQAETGGRRRRHYRITPAGEAALSAWLADPVTEPSEIRDMGLLKLFFGAAGRRGDIEALARGQAAAHRARLADYRAIRAEVTGRALPLELRTLELGERYEEMCARFWDEIAADHA